MKHEIIGKSKYFLPMNRFTGGYYPMALSEIVKRYEMTPSEKAYFKIKCLKRIEKEEYRIQLMREALLA